MLLSVDEINRWTWAFAKATGMKWKEMVNQSDHRLFFPKIFGVVSERKIVLRGFRTPEKDEADREYWRYSTRFRMEVINAPQLFFRIGKGEDDWGTSINKRINIKANNRQVFLNVLPQDQQTVFLELWDDQEDSHFSLKGHILEMELQWVIHCKEDMEKTAAVLDFMVGLANRLENYF